MTSRKLKMGKSEELSKKNQLLRFLFTFFVLFYFVGFSFVCLFPHIYTIFFSISKNLIFPVC